MDPAISFLEALSFFQRKPIGHLNSPEYAAAFCQNLKLRGHLT
jgi:hypothetical protein